LTSSGSPYTLSQPLTPVQLVTLGIGTRLGPYELLSSLGAGGMSAVYRAKDTPP